MRDVARLTRHLVQASPALDYHVAVDRRGLSSASADFVDVSP